MSSKFKKGRPKQRIQISSKHKFSNFLNDKPDGKRNEEIIQEEDKCQM